MSDRYLKFEEIPSIQTFVRCETYWFDKSQNKIMPQTNVLIINTDFIESMTEQDDFKYGVNLNGNHYTLRFLK
jgi:hypothetical protein